MASPAAAAPPPEPPVRPALHNVVATCSLDVPLNLRQIAERAKNTEHVKTKSKETLVMRLLRPPELRCTASVFASGKVRVMGLRSVECARRAARRIARLIQKAGHDVRFCGFEVQTVMASCDVRFPIHLERLHHVHSYHCTYEPEISPSLVYRVQDDGGTQGVVLNIFGSGKMMITKARSEDDVQRAFDMIYEVLMQFRKERRDASDTQDDDAHEAMLSNMADDVERAPAPEPVVKPAASAGRGPGRGRGRGRGRARGEPTKSPARSTSTSPVPTKGANTTAAQLMEVKPAVVVRDEEELCSDDDDEELLSMIQ